MRETITADRIVPIDRFARDGAEAIFSEVQDGREKYVFKDNLPFCVLIHPEDFTDLVNAVNDMIDYIEILECEAEGKPSFPARLRLLDRWKSMPWYHADSEEE